ncbi:MAG TPA: chemotaxis protein CheB [Rhodanobacter sp.]|nr:chemotaxis protein CheB [Rhodanobacter sp.]
MTDALPAVALLFDDGELGGQLRAALQERGARIVHEGGVSGFSRELLDQVGADVVVVNLDDNADDALDRLYEVIDGDRPRVVFNDADASRTLDGWDRARWARHLAVKVLAMGDLDPPRPEDALPLDEPATPVDVPVPLERAAVEPESRSAASIEPETAIDEPAPGLESTPVETAVPSVTDFQADPGPDSGAMSESEAQPEPESELEPELELEPEPEPEPAFNPESALEPDSLPGTEPEWLATPAPGDEREHRFAADLAAPATTDGVGDDLVEEADSDSLAAELEALLASGDLPDDEDEVSGPGLRYVGNDEPPALHDGDFSTPLQDSDEAAIGEQDRMSLDASAASSDADHAPLTAVSAPSLVAMSDAAAEPAITVSPPVVQAPDGWALIDDDAAPPAPSPAPASSCDKPDASEFGIEKLSAAEFLAPDAGPGVDDSEPTMSLELVSLEEAIAPQAYLAPAHEMVLDEPGSALSRIVLLGAAVDGVASVCDFLGALPANTRQTFLLTQHLGGQPEAVLVERFSAHCSLPVRLADGATRAKAGEVLMVPAGHQVQLRRDGSVELQARAAEEAQDLSIDASLSMAASAFGRDALAIIFAGRGNDAVAGAQAIHDRGGQVWVESSSGEHFADMVSGIFAERLVSFSGTPPELAAHLSEVFS